MNAPVFGAALARSLPAEPAAPVGATRSHRCHSRSSGQWDDEREFSETLSVMAYR